MKAKFTHELCMHDARQMAKGFAKLIKTDGTFDINNDVDRRNWDALNECRAVIIKKSRKYE